MKKHFQLRLRGFQTHKVVPKHNTLLQQIVAGNEYANLWSEVSYPQKVSPILFILGRKNNFSLLSSFFVHNQWMPWIYSTSTKPRRWYHIMNSKYLTFAFTIAVEIIKPCCSPVDSENAIRKAWECKVWCFGRRSRRSSNYVHSHFRKTNNKFFEIPGVQMHGASI